MDTFRIFVPISAVLILMGQMVLATPQTHGGSDQAIDVSVRGQKQHLHHYMPSGSSANRRVLFVPGDGGWRGWAITIAQTMASWGYDVYGLDTKTYLDGFTLRARLTERDIMNDFRELASSMTGRSGERVTFVGWSEGAGLGVLATAAEGNKSVFDGLIAFGLEDDNAIAWHPLDNLVSLVKKVDEPTFKASDHIANIAPLPLLMIQSSHDQYASLDEANRLFSRAREPKRFALVDGKDHRFDGNQDEFFRTLRDGLQWVLQPH